MRMESIVLRLGTRSSALAMAQSVWVKERIEEHHRGIDVELVPISTRGDRILDRPLSEIGGKGLFVKEIEESLLCSDIDIAVHSMKDMPADLPEGLELGVFPERESPLDVIVSVYAGGIEELPSGARVGTGSLRRSAQLRNLRSDLEVLPIRGNVDTRLRKLDEGRFDAVILAEAGLKRLGLEARVSGVLTPLQILPAVGQGALGLEMRVNDSRTHDILAFLHDEPTMVAVRAERAFLKELNGGCQVPIGGLALVDGSKVLFTGLVAELDGSRIIRRTSDGPCAEAGNVGKSVALSVLAAGGGEILENVQHKNFV
jgi:hydroxymethylbilane synthase